MRGPKRFVISLLVVCVPFVAVVMIVYATNAPETTTSTFLADLFQDEPSPDDEEAAAKAVAYVEALDGYVSRNRGRLIRPVTDARLGGDQVTDLSLKELAPFKNLATLQLV